MARGPAGPQIAGSRADFQTTYSYFPAISKPILAAVNGPAVGLGLVIALYCDLRFASDQAQVRHGLRAAGVDRRIWHRWMLPRLVGLAGALDLLYSARVIDATEALRMGLVSRVIPQASFLEEVRAYARELATSVSPRSLRVIKQQVYGALFQTLGEAIDSANEEMLAEFPLRRFSRGCGALPRETPAGLHRPVMER